ncbi:MAG: threonine synthase [bacterium]
MRSWRGIIEEYRPHLPLESDWQVVTLLEGNTPLLRCDRLADGIGMDIELYMKFEGLNPTGSFKDRGMSMAVTQAVNEGATALICASTGNTAAAAAAYAARAGMRAFVVIPHGHVATGKLSQAVMHGARIISIDGNFDQALELVRQAAERYPVKLVNSVNPFRIQGQKTAAFEVCDQLEQAPDFHFLPVGNAGNITAYWKGYVEYEQGGTVNGRPRMMGYEAEGAAPIVRGHVVEDPQTIATAIRIGNPASWQQAEAARDQSDGEIGMVSDAEIVAAYRLLASTEGIFCEPASAAGVAGLIKGKTDGAVPPGSVVVCTLTGHGLKDPTTALAQVGEAVRVPAALENLAEALEVA